MEDEASDISYININESLKKHVEKCKNKSRYHHTNAVNALYLDNILTLTELVLSATLTLLMVILSVYDINEDIVAITSASFAFSSIVVSKIRQNYNFGLVSYSHHSVSDDFMTLRYEFISLITEENYDTKDFKTVINKYLTVCAKGHIQSVNLLC